MVTTIPLRILAGSKLAKNANWCLRSKPLANHVPCRYAVQEFPGLRYDNAPPNDYILILPESTNQDAKVNELLKIPKVGEPEIEFSKINPEHVFKGFSQTINAFENFITDINNETIQIKGTFEEILRDIEQNLYPMDVAYNILMLLSSVDAKNYNHPEFADLVKKYFVAREKRVEGTLLESITASAGRSLDKLAPVDKAILRHYNIATRRKSSTRPLDTSSMVLFRENLVNDCRLFRKNVFTANQLFSHTVDDPDILAAVSNDLDDCRDMHHRERTPLQVSIATYNRFMQVCPDRFVRQMLWQNFNKRCSPKASPKQNNSLLIKDIRVQRRKIADLLGYRTHIDMKLENTMALSKHKVIDLLSALNEENRPIMTDRLQELNEYAADNSFEDPSQAGIQEYDVDFWAHKYTHDILLGINEPTLRSYFPLSSVLTGLRGYFKDYFGIDMKPKELKSWSSDVLYYEVSRNGAPIGNILYDPYQRDNKTITDFSYARLRSKIHGSLPSRVIMTSLKPDQANKEAYLNFTDITLLYYTFSLVIQRLLYNYKYYELNNYGAFEEDAKDLLPNLCVAHLLTDHRIIQSCSDRGGSKRIDSETASRILKGFTYFKPLKTWRELYMAHLDQDVHTVLSDIKDLAEDIHSIYSPFRRSSDSYDFCTMEDIFVGPNDGIQYAQLWSKLLANFCLSQVTAGDNIRKVDDAKAKEFYGQLVDSLFSTENLSTNSKLISLTNKSFEPTKTSLGVL